MTESTTSEADIEQVPDPVPGEDGAPAEDGPVAGNPAEARGAADLTGAQPDDEPDDAADDAAGDESVAAGEVSGDESDVSGSGSAAGDGVDAAPGDAADDGDAEGGVAVLEREGDIAADYLEELLDIADLDGDLDMDVEGDRAAVSIVGGDVSMLVGRNGEVLEALQELTRLAVYRETGRRSRLMLDVGGFRADVRSRLERIAADAVEQVKQSGERLPLSAMSPFERKVVHDAVAAAGLGSESEGEEPRRHVVVLPK